MEQEIIDFTRGYIRELYSKILDASEGKEEQFQRLAGIAARQLAKETFRLLGPENTDKAFNLYANSIISKRMGEENRSCIEDGQGKI